MTANREFISESLLVRRIHWSTSVTWVDRASPATGPLSVRIVCQARVRIRKLVKKGAITSTRRKFFHLPAFWVMKYASG